MEQQARDIQTSELRSEVRKAAAAGASIEFKPSAEAMTYHVALRDYSDSGLGILVKNSSDIFRHVRVGDVFHMRYHKGDASPEPEHLKVEIKHISEPAGGKPRDHMVIGLCILERTDAADLSQSGYWQST